MSAASKKHLLRVSSTCTLALVFSALTAQAQAPPLVAAMATNEVAAREQGVHYSFTSEERSARTGGRLWREKVVETDDGPLRRLIAIDGQPLSASATNAEASRVRNLVEHPDQFRQENAAHKDDETHATNLLVLLSKAFILIPDGDDNGCTRFRFRPYPAYEPSSYEERVAHAMVGTVSLRQPMDRLCQMQATIKEPVEFGFGLFGKIAPGGGFRLKRQQVDAKNWKSDEIHVDISGRILLLKSLAQKQDTTRVDIHVVPPHLTLAQAAALVMQ